MSRSEEENYAQNRLRTAKLEQRRALIRTLNDEFRTTGSGGRWVVTPGIHALGSLAPAIIRMVRTFEAFSDDNDPYGEHDFGSIDHAGRRIFWKIDCYDKQLECGSPDPTDPDITARVITVMLASEY